MVVQNVFIRPPEGSYIYYYFYCYYCYCLFNLCEGIDLRRRELIEQMNRENLGFEPATIWS